MSTPSSILNSGQIWVGAVPFPPDPRLCSLAPMVLAPTFRFLALTGPLPSTPLCGTWPWPLCARQSVPLALSPSTRAAQLVAKHPMLPPTQEVGARPCRKSTFICYMLLVNEIVQG